MPVTYRMHEWTGVRQGKAFAHHQFTMTYLHPDELVAIWRWCADNLGPEREGWVGSGNVVGINDDHLATLFKLFWVGE